MSLHQKNDVKRLLSTSHSKANIVPENALSGGVPMLRLSNYSILSDPLPGGGYALMNGGNGAIDLISNDLARTLSQRFGFRGEQGRRQPPANGCAAAPLSDEAAEFLQQRGHLTRLSPQEERDRVGLLADALHEEQKQRPVFMIVPSFDCNYRCTYCFERPLQKGLVSINSPINYEKKNVVMSPTHVSALYECIARIKKAAGDTTRGGRITLYGGEPLNADNKATVFEIVRQGAAHGFVFAAISNGHDWEHFLPVMGECGIAEIQVSIDGPQPVHDRRRISRRGESSFAKIVENVNLALSQSDTMIEVRVHVDAGNIDVFDQVLSICEAEGWLDNRRVVVYANTVYAKAQGQVSARLDTGDIMRRLRESAARWKNVFVGAPSLNARTQVLPSLLEGTPYRLKSTYCAANTGNYIFAPDGNIYACWESVGKDCSRIGSYLPELNFDEKMCGKWFSRSTARIPECLACPFALVCGGGCAQYAEYNTGEQLKPYCDDFGRVYRAALADTVEEFIQAQEATEVAAAAPA
jgi:uncharacterized protein